MTALGWIVLGPVAAFAVTFVAGRLLGARRGWSVLVLSGVIGFTAGVVAAGILTDWAWSELAMALLTLVFGTVFTMAVAVGFDMLAPVGSLATGEQAGVISLRNPVADLRRALTAFRRYRDVLARARDNGVMNRRVTTVDLPVGVRRTLEEAGGIFVKLGQIASTRSDVLPPAWCDELARLRSAAVPAPEAAMRPHLTEELGADPESVFARFDWAPMASASMSQIYAATLTDGTDVVVKVLRPGLDEIVAIDSEAVMRIARAIEQHTEFGLSVRPARLAAEFLDNVAEELDFTIEASNAVDLAAAMHDLDWARVPAIHSELSSRQVLVEERIDAPTIDELGRRSDGSVDLRAVADRLMDAFLVQVFREGVFHADPHPGNILVEEDGTLVFIDLGAVGRLGPGHRAAVLDMLVAAANGAAGDVRRSLASITVFDRRVDVRQLDEALEEFLAKHLSAGGGVTAATFQDLIALIGTYGIVLPR